FLANEVSVPFGARWFLASARADACPSARTARLTVAALLRDQATQSPEGRIASGSCRIPHGRAQLALATEKRSSPLRPRSAAGRSGGRWRGSCIGVDNEQVYSALVKRSPDAEQELNVGDRRHLAGNGLRLVMASAMQSSGDQTVNASTVLPWLFHALGVPPALIGVLVPIREAGSMLPQALLTPLVLKFDHRKWVFVTGAVVQAACVGVMAITAAFGGGLVAGLIIVLALATFALGRCLCSIASKDVQGRTVPKGERGQSNGLATTASGLVAVTLGLGIRLIGGADLSAGQLAWLLAAGACLWAGAATVYSRIREPSAAVPQTTDRQTQAGRDDNWFVQIYRLVRDDRD